MFWRKRRLPHPQTLPEAIELLQRRLGPAPNPDEAAACAEWKSRVGPEIGKPEFALVRTYLVRVFNALPPEDHPGWRHDTFNPAAAVDWDEVLGDLPGYVPGSGPGPLAAVAASTYHRATRESA
jgi:hypothetical protein